MEKLKPCPFCGNKFVWLSQKYQILDSLFGYIDEWYVCCNRRAEPSGCGARIYSRVSREDAAQKWNRRANDV